MIKTLNKKGQNVNALIGLAVGIGVAGIITAFMLQIGGDIQTDMANANPNITSSEFNATGDMITAVAKIATKLSIIVTIVIAVFIIGLLVKGFGR